MSRIDGSFKHLLVSLIVYFNLKIPGQRFLMGCQNTMESERAHIQSDRVDESPISEESEVCVGLVTQVLQRLTV